MPENKNVGIKKLGMGWLRDLPSPYDYTIEQALPSSRVKNMGKKDTVKDMIKKLKVQSAAKPLLPNSKDLREFCSPIEDQEYIGSCTAHAGVGLLEYYEIRAFKRYIDASRLFLYKTTRNLLQITGDTGAYLRSTMGSMVLFGVPPEKYWPYDTLDFDVEPNAFCYSFAQNYQSLQYYRLDDLKTTPEKLLLRIKAFINAGLPSMFGFTVFSSINQARLNDGKIPFPCPNDTVEGGHAVVAVGYDDKLEIVNSNCKHVTKGALLIRNSWGEDWGEKGYGWLPYEYVLNGLAVDWWSLIKNEWVDTGNFGE